MWSVSLSRVPHILRSRRALTAVALAACALPASSASASTVSLKVTDPAGDSTGGNGLDITGATIVQDTSSGTVTATVTYAAAPTDGSALAIGLGKLKGTDCNIGADDGSSAVVFLANITSPLQGIWAMGGAQAYHAVTPTLSGTTFKVATGGDADLKKFTWNCATVAAQAVLSEDSDPVGDTAMASGTGTGGLQTVVLTDKPDADKDGVPDVVDACPKVAGASANGCLTIAAKKALRLGAKRVAVDIMVPRTAATCKAVAKGVVKDGRKTIGKGTLEVGVHGSFCHISGAIKTKKHGKKVKVTISGSGFKKISKAIK